MKLVELLARELVEWPDEAVAIAQDSDGGAHPYKSACLDFDGEEWIGQGAFGVTFSTYNTQMDLSSDHATAIVTREKWEEERARLAVNESNDPFVVISIDREYSSDPDWSKTEWDGEGLPPVGTVCEAWHNGSAQGVVEVRYAGDFMVLWNVKREYEQCSVAKDYSFRPIRTQEQIAAQERDDACRQMLVDASNGCFVDVKDSRSWAQAYKLYDAGWRKQEQSE